MPQRQSPDSFTCEPGFVLAVDDDRADLKSVDESLGPLALTVRECADAHAAMASLCEEEFAVALVDVRMPGVGGFELAEEIRRHPRAGGLPILFVTGAELSPEEVRRAYALKAADVVAKPFAPEVLRTKVSVFVELDRRRRMAELRRELEELVLVTAQSAHVPVRAVNYLLRELHGSVVRKDANLERLLGSFRGQARRTDRLLCGLFELSRLRLEPEAMSDLDLAVPIVSAACAVQAEFADVRGEFEVGEIPRVHAHPAQMRQLFRELFGHAMNARGRMTPEVRVCGRPLSGEVRVTVRDNGVGVLRGGAERVFEPFAPPPGPFRPGCGPGTGVGMELALAQRIVHLNGGRIWCEANEDGIGTRVSFTLPEAFA